MKWRDPEYLFDGWRNPMISYDDFNDFLFSFSSLISILSLSLPLILLSLIFLSFFLSLSPSFSSLEEKLLVVWSEKICKEIVFEHWIKFIGVQNLKAIFTRLIGWSATAGTYVKFNFDISFVFLVPPLNSLPPQWRVEIIGAPTWWKNRPPRNDSLMRWA